MSVVWLCGGEQRGAVDDRPEWHHYGRAVIAELRLSDGSLRRRVEHVTPAEACAEDDPAILFKAGTLVGDRFYACTQTEVFVYGVPEFEQLAYVSLPHFNDVHHVRPAAGGGLLIANTGLDMVLHIDSDGRVVREWSVVDEDPWQRFSKNVDYRRLSTTKPHLAHPNYVFELNGEIWVTRFEQRDAITLTGPRFRIDIGVERPHDGIVAGDALLFTTVDGCVVEATPREGVKRVIDLNRLAPSGAPLGWCRGLEVVDPRHVLVGFSRLRPTRFRENLAWLRKSLRVGTGPALPTRFALIDLVGEKLVWERNLEEVGLNTLFSIHLRGSAEDVLGATP